MYDPASDLTILKKICKELQKELAYSATDTEAVMRLSQEVTEAAARIREWADK
jgi:hypothetical protein